MMTANLLKEYESVLAEHRTVSGEVLMKAISEVGVFYNTTGNYEVCRKLNSILRNQSLSRDVRLLAYQMICNIFYDYEKIVDSVRPGFQFPEKVDLDAMAKEFGLRKAGG